MTIVPSSVISDVQGAKRGSKTTRLRLPCESRSRGSRWPRSDVAENVPSLPLHLSPPRACTDIHLTFELTASRRACCRRGSTSESSPIGHGRNSPPRALHTRQWQREWRRPFMARRLLRWRRGEVKLVGDRQLPTPLPPIPSWGFGADGMDIVISLGVGVKWLTSDERACVGSGRRVSRRAPSFGWPRSCFRTCSRTDAGVNVPGGLGAGLMLPSCAGRARDSSCIARARWRVVAGRAGLDRSSCRIVIASQGSWWRSTPIFLRMGRSVRAKARVEKSCSETRATRRRARGFRVLDGRRFHARVAGGSRVRQVPPQPDSRWRSLHPEPRVGVKRRRP